MGNPDWGKPSVCIIYEDTKKDRSFCNSLKNLSGLLSAY